LKQEVTGSPEDVEPFVHLAAIRTNTSTPEARSLSFKAKQGADHRYLEVSYNYRTRLDDFMTILAWAREKVRISTPALVIPEDARSAQFSACVRSTSDNLRVAVKGAGPEDAGGVGGTTLVLRTGVCGSVLDPCLSFEKTNDGLAVGESEADQPIMIVPPRFEDLDNEHLRLSFSGLDDSAIEHYFGIDRDFKEKAWTPLLLVEQHKLQLLAIDYPKRLAYLGDKPEPLTFEWRSAVDGREIQALTATYKFGAKPPVQRLAGEDLALTSDFHPVAEFRPGASDKRQGLVGSTEVRYYAYSRHDCSSHFSGEGIEAKGNNALMGPVLYDPLPRCLRFLRG